MRIFLAYTTILFLTSCAVFNEQNTKDVHATNKENSELDIMRLDCAKAVEESASHPEKFSKSTCAAAFDGALDGYNVGSKMVYAQVTKQDQLEIQSGIEKIDNICKFTHSQQTVSEDWTNGKINRDLAEAYYSDNTTTHQWNPWEQQFFMAQVAFLRRADTHMNCKDSIRSMLESDLFRGPTSQTPPQFWQDPNFVKEECQKDIQSYKFKNQNFQRSGCYRFIRGIFGGMEYGALATFSKIKGERQFQAMEKMSQNQKRDCIFNEVVENSLEPETIITLARFYSQPHHPIEGPSNLTAGEDFLKFLLSLDNCLEPFSSSAKN